MKRYFKLFLTPDFSAPRRYKLFSKNTIFFRYIFFRKNERLPDQNKTHPPDRSGEWDLQGFGGITAQRGLDPDGQDQTRAVMGSHHGPAPLVPTARTRMPARLPEV